MRAEARAGQAAAGAAAGRRARAHAGLWAAAGAGQQAHGGQPPAPVKNPSRCSLWPLVASFAAPDLRSLVCHGDQGLTAVDLAEILDELRPQGRSLAQRCGRTHGPAPAAVNRDLSAIAPTHRPASAPCTALLLALLLPRQGEPAAAARWARPQRDRARGREPSAPPPALHTSRDACVSPAMLPLSSGGSWSVAHAAKRIRGAVPVVLATPLPPGTLTHSAAGCTGPPLLAGTARDGKNASPAGAHGGGHRARVGTSRCCRQRQCQACLALREAPRAAMPRRRATGRRGRRR